MPESITQINTLQDGTTTFGEYPDPAIQASIEVQHNKKKNAEANFQATVDLNNLNSQYSDALAFARSYFTDRGLEPAPLRVIDRETLHRAYNIEGITMDDMIGQEEGRSVNGRALVIENQELIEMFGDDFVLGMALHEAAHSLNTGEHLVRTVEEHGKRIALGGIATHTGTMSKADLRKSTKASVVGDFWEEAFADLTRVRALRALGRTHDIEGNTNPFQTQNGTTLMGVPNETVADQPGIISLPAEFAFLAKTIEDKNWMARGPSNFTAYALELLDNRAPGLYDDLLASRQDPAKQRDAIRKIESIRPGLYRQLRDLEYNERDFVHGLKLVMEALDAGVEERNQKAPAT